MVEAISDKIVAHAIDNNYIKQIQQDEYSYGLNMLFNIVMGDITLLFIGWIMRMLPEAIAFWLLYKSMRKYCGGFHFSTSLKCYLSSCVMCPAALLAIKYMPYNIWIWSISFFAVSVILFILSPVPAVNKPLDEKEKVMFGRIAKAIIGVVSLAYIISLSAHWKTAASIILISVICVSFFAVVGKLQLKIKR